jgi:hypothetical protein
MKICHFFQIPADALPRAAFGPPRFEVSHNSLKLPEEAYSWPNPDGLNRVDGRSCNSLKDQDVRVVSPILEKVSLRYANRVKTPTSDR